ncbi:MAG: Peptidyl-prolyl cis-trans isomerase cyp10 [Chaenotheca gracillima]|nr:MAG: Peptidyl-prolyl cis-trans isomerase cyp10 [Chaenotheca gracillima]
MSGFQHTYGPKCRLRKTKSASKLRPSPGSATEGPDAEPEEPSLNVHYFYTSTLPIDEPLSPLPPPTSNPTALSKIPPRPFSELDNAALEEAWVGVFEGQRREEKALKQVGVNLRDNQSEDESGKIGDQAKSPKLSESESERPGLRLDHGSSGPRTINRPDRNGEQRPTSAAGSHDSRGGKANSPSSFGGSPNDKSTTGTPFLRAPSRKGRFVSSASTSDPVGKSESHVQSHRRSSSLVEPQTPGDGSVDSRPSTAEPAPAGDEAVHGEDGDNAGVEVTVGISRLHLVKVPELQMEPIYWSPVGDVSPVTRGTWFYKDIMEPVEADLANQLEKGYKELKPWTETWSDELTSAIRVGAEGEVKVIYRIWPEEDEPKKQRTSIEAGEPRPSVLAASTGAELQTELPAVEPSTRAAQGTILPPGTTTATASGAKQRFPNSHVVYANAKEAFILKPSLIPSAYYGRRPVAKIIKGTRVGVAVVRGFDKKKWNWLHPPQEAGAYAVRADEIAQMSRSGTAATDRNKACKACLALEQTQKVSDLVLVIHGIGQQLSKRIESYAFTHAINSFRRQIHVQLGKYAVQNHLRKDVGGIMALPVNWRSTLSFEDGGLPPVDDEEPRNTHANNFSLKDITPETIPAIRSLISDVMLDIPYYLSHHKPKMVEGVIREANRVYRLWCLNNPGFEKYGRVHVVAHSLGSAMALDVLSKQPTNLPVDQIDPTSRIINDQFFNFDTTNLFMCGSPAGFFLLLNRASLLPREERNKPGAGGDDRQPGVTGHTGTYGCLAVDNVYNVMNFNDPVAYRLNAAVDTRYASSLRPAVIPSATPSFFSNLGAAFNFSSTVPAGPPTTAEIPPAATTTKAPTPGAVAAMNTLHRLPANVELETHNFTHEEIAEKRMHLLNDNGQIDYFLPSSSSFDDSGGIGGNGAAAWMPLAEQMQYLNMLGAHSAYWVSRDFVRFLVVEVGRRRGRDGTLPAMRAVKKGVKR